MAVITPNSDVILLKVPLEIDEANQLTFSNATAQYNYFHGLGNKLVLDKYTYQRKDDTIRIGALYDDIYSYNYVMYRNTNHGNKWFYAFITGMEYINDSVTAVKIKTDVWQTWQFDLNYKTTFVEREHVNDDTIGKHTVPEDLETGEYICNEHYKDPTMDNYSNDLCFVMASTSQPVAGEAKETVSPSGIFNGIYTGLTYYRYDDTNPIDIMLEIFANDGKTSAINGIFMAPKWLAPLSGGVLRDVAQSNTPASFDINVSKQTTLNSYSPKNNKVKCFPYNYLLISNNVGQDTILHYEKFSSDNATFTVRGVLNPGCSINLTPTNYNGNVSSDSDAIQLGKFPICNFQNDMYTNWLTQNSINVLGQTITSDDINVVGNIIGGVSGIATSALSGNMAGAGLAATSGISGVAGAVMQQKQHNMITPSIVGKLNSADVNVASGRNTFHFYKMSVKAEYAKIIDDYFSAYGYKVNSVKLPNITGRTNWNYVKTIGCYIDADIPQDDLQEIKSMFDKGITFWHNASTFGDYSQSNTIVV